MKTLETHFKVLKHETHNQTKNHNSTIAAYRL
jgi:hypothetical protein